VYVCLVDKRIRTQECGDDRRWRDGHAGQTPRGPLHRIRRGDRAGESERRGRLVYLGLLGKSMYVCMCVCMHVNMCLSVIKKLMFANVCMYIKGK
jgi:hypothetical protein